MSFQWLISLLQWPLSILDLVQTSGGGPIPGLCSKKQLPAGCSIALIAFGLQVVMPLTIELEKTEEFGHAYTLLLIDSSSKVEIPKTVNALYWFRRMF
jgi:hypothetical protein